MMVNRGTTTRRGPLILRGITPPCFFWAKLRSGGRTVAAEKVALLQGRGRFLLQERRAGRRSASETNAATAGHAITRGLPEGRRVMQASCEVRPPSLQEFGLVSKLQVAR